MSFIMFLIGVGLVIYGFSGEGGTEILKWILLIVAGILCLAMISKLPGKFTVSLSILIIAFILKIFK